MAVQPSEAMNLVDLLCVKPERTKPMKFAQVMGPRLTTAEPLTILRWCILYIATLFVPTAVMSQGIANNEVSQLRKQANDIRSSANSLIKVQRIPWIADVFEGFRLAKEENRPVFLYVITGDPLGDC
jgi:hypothetical protein